MAEHGRLNIPTTKLAYVIYYDNKTNKLRKESSWEQWRDKSIEPVRIVTALMKIVMLYISKPRKS